MKYAPTPNETDTIKLISDWLSIMKIVHIRINSGVCVGEYEDKQGNVKKRFVRFVRIFFPDDKKLKFPDLQIIYKGVTAYVEVKRKGAHKNSKGQDAFLRLVIKEGGYAAKVNCLEEIQSIITDIKENHSSINRGYRFNGYGL